LALGDAFAMRWAEYATSPFPGSEGDLQALAILDSAEITAAKSLLAPFWKREEPYRRQEPSWMRLLALHLMKHRL
jgi:hypothetical protein